MFRTIAAITAVLTTVALLASTTQSIEPQVLLSQDTVQNAVFDGSGAIRVEKRG